MKKVLLIATVQSHIGQFHKPLMQLLKENGWEIHVAARNNLSEKNGLQLEYPDRVFDIPFQRSPFDSRNIKAFKKLAEILKTEHYDVIHCNTPVGGILGRLAARKYRRTGTKVYYTAHGFHFYDGAPKKNWIIYYPIEKWASQFTDKLITITEEDYKLAQKSFQCPCYRIHGVGANSKKYYPISAEEQSKRKKELEIDGPVILNVGELLPNKNQKAAIYAMKQVVQHYPDAKLLIAGNGPEKETLVKLAKNLKIENQVVFLGYTTNLQQYMQLCDVEISCSYREGLPLNVIEAMLCGKPVVASINRGHKELIHEKTGVLVSPDDIEGYSKAICQVIRTTAHYYTETIRMAGQYRDINVQEELRRIYQL